jgi:hypothetical protein
MATSEPFKKLLPQSWMVLSAAVVATAIATPVKALQIFYGQDAGLGKNTRLVNRPNADGVRDRFLSHLLNVKTEDFENFSSGCYESLYIQFPQIDTVTLDGKGCIRNFPTGTNGAGRYPISGNKYWDTFSDFSIIFRQPVAALGFYASDIGDFKGHLTLTLKNDTTAKTLTIPSTPDCPNESLHCQDGSVLYFGVIAQTTSELFTEVIFGNVGKMGDFFGFDNLSIGSVKQIESTLQSKSIPERTSVLATLAFGVLGVVCHLLLKQT